MNKERLHELFEYRNGELFWKVTRSNNTKAGAKAGSVNSKGYLTLRVDGKHQRVSRVVFMMHHGYLPEIIDHINGNKLDNRIENLREATVQQNNMNAKTKVTNKSGVKGVSWHPLGNKWMVRIMINGKDKYFGMYEDLEFATLVAQEARNKLHGEFARHA